MEIYGRRWTIYGCKHVTRGDFGEREWSLEPPANSCAECEEIEVVPVNHQPRGAVSADREALIEDAMHEINVRWQEDEDAPLPEALVRETAEAVVSHCLRAT